MKVLLRHSITAVLLLATSLVASGDFIARAEAEIRRNSKGKVLPRVVRDKDRQVIRLFLNGMTLSAAELAELKNHKRLKALVLFRTNITDHDLKHVEACKNLEHLNLTSTQVTDAAVESILKLGKLKTVCLGNVKIAPEALDKLRAQNRRRDEPLRWGYSQRKP